MKKIFIFTVVLIAFFVLTGFETGETLQAWVGNTDTGNQLIAKDGPIGIFRVIYDKEVVIPKDKKAEAEVEGFLSSLSCSDVVVEKLELTILSGEATTDSQTWFNIWDGVKKSLFIFSNKPGKVKVKISGVAKYKLDYQDKEYKTWNVEKEIEIEFKK